MRGHIAGAVQLGRSVVELAAETQVTFLAAAVAYYASFSLVPLVLLGVAAATALGGEALSDQLLDVTAGILTSSGRDLVLGAMSSPAGRSGATIAGTVALGWGALKGFRALDRAFSEVYGSTEADTFLGAIVDAAVVLALLGIAVGAMLIAGAAAALLPGPAFGEFGAIGLVFALFVVFFPLYWFFPDVELRPDEALPGAAFAAVGWTVLGVGFRLYAEYAAGFAIYGLLGALLLLLTWLYAGAIILIVGAAVNAVLSGHTRNR